MWQSKPALNAITVTYTLMIVVDLMGQYRFLKTYRMDKHIWPNSYYSNLNFWHENLEYKTHMKTSLKNVKNV